MSSLKNFYGGAGSLSPEVEENTNARIGENLIINSHFLVNQYFGIGATNPVESESYVCDRWSYRSDIDPSETVSCTHFDTSVGGRYIRMNHTNALRQGALRYTHECLGWKMDDLVGRKLIFAVSVSFDHEVDMYVNFRFRIGTTVVPGTLVFSPTCRVEKGICYFEYVIPDADYSGGTNADLNFQIHIDYGAEATGFTGLPDGGYRFIWTKLEFNDVPTKYIPAQYADELARCQRYYYKSANTTGGYNGSTIGWWGATTNATTYALPHKFVVPMRVTPTLEILSVGSVGFDANTVSLDSPTTEGFISGATANETRPQGYWRLAYSADADYA